MTSELGAGDKSIESKSKCAEAVHPLGQGY